METDTNTESLSTLQVPVYDAPALISWHVWCQTLQNHLLVTPTLEYFFVVHNFLNMSKKESTSSDDDSEPDVAGVWNAGSMLF